MYNNMHPSVFFGAEIRSQVLAALDTPSLCFLLMDVDSLSPPQRDALAQLQALTNGGDAEVAIGVLSSVDWDVQVC